MSNGTLSNLYISIPVYKCWPGQSITTEDKLSKSPKLTKNCSHYPSVMYDSARDSGIDSALFLLGSESVNLLLECESESRILKLIKPWQGMNKLDWNWKRNQGFGNGIRIGMESRYILLESESESDFWVFLESEPESESSCMVVHSCTMHSPLNLIIPSWMSLTITCLSIPGIFFISYQA